MPLNFPNSPTDGQIYTDSTTGNRYSWDNTRQIWKWSPNTVSTSVSSLPPGSPAQGTLWWNTELGRLFIYYVDEDTGQWVEASPVPGVNTGISNTVAAAFNTANSAFNTANSRLANTDIVITGNVTSTQGMADRVGDVRNLPIVNQTASYTISLTDNGEVVSVTTGNVFVTANVFFAGNTVTVYNNSSANVTITQNTGVTLQWAGLSNTGNRILQQRGLATLVCVAANTFVLTGAGFVA
jgi:hypothetical protein